MKSERQRQVATKLEEPLPLWFDVTPPWPQKFGPGNIRKALLAGYYVLAELHGIPKVWSISRARWINKVLEVYSGSQGWRIPTRIWTARDLRGIKF